MKIIVVIACTMITASCVIQHKPRPYEGIQKNSYGNLSNITLTPCDHNAPPQEWTKDAVGSIAKYINGGMTYDENIVKEDLQDQFRLPADTGLATVAILSRSNDEIVFWYSLGMVSYFEVSNAATKFCGYDNRTAIPEGSAQRCGEPQKNIAKVLKQDPDYFIPTYVISGFACK